MGCQASMPAVCPSSPVTQTDDTMPVSKNSGSLTDLPQSTMIIADASTPAMLACRDEQATSGTEHPPDNIIFYFKALEGFPEPTNVCKASKNDTHKSSKGN